MHTNNSLKLRDAALAAPPATGAAGEWASQMAEALREAVTPGDLAEIMKGVVAKAKEGDAKAVQQVLDFVGKQQPARGQVVIGIRGRPSDSENGPGPRTVEALPPANELRRDCAEVLGTHAPLTTAELAAKAGYEPAEVEEALVPAGPGTLAHYFDRDEQGRWRLTSLGRATLLSLNRRPP